MRRSESEAAESPHMQKPSTIDIDPVIYLAIELSASTWLVVSKIPTSEKTGLHRTPEEALVVMRSMASRWSDEHITVVEPDGNAYQSRKKPRQRTVSVRCEGCKGCAPI